MTWLFSKALCESLPYLPEPEVESSEDTFSDGEPSAQWNVMPTPQGFWRNDKMMDASRLSRFGPTLRLLTEQHGEAVLMSFLAAFPVRTYPQQDEAKESAGQDPDFGLSSLESLAKYDLDTSSWRTPQYSLLEDLELYSETWPRWGLMRNGECWVHPMLALRTNVTESGLLPTPNVPSGDGLATAVNNFPTPSASEHKYRKSGNSQQSKSLGAIAAKTGNGQLNPAWVEWLMNWPVNWTSLEPINHEQFQFWQKSSAAIIQGEEMREMWFHKDPAAPPYGQEPGEQCAEQCGNPVPVMLPERVGADMCESPLGFIPRVTTGLKWRVDRLKAIGNGQVPAVAARAFLAALE